MSNKTYNESGVVDSTPENTQKMGGGNDTIFDPNNRIQQHVATTDLGDQSHMVNSNTKPLSGKMSDLSHGTWPHEVRYEKPK